MKISGFAKESITDGKGIRYTVFTQGCPHHCKGCHNPDTWGFEGGEEMGVEEIFEDFKKYPLASGITLSGGEPFCQPEECTELAKLVHKMGKNVTAYTGYTYEELSSMGSEILALLNEVDVLVDGKFIEEQKNLELLFRGSENQRLIDMRKTRESGKIILLEEN